MQNFFLKFENVILNIVRVNLFHKIPIVAYNIYHHKQTYCIYIEEIFLLFLL